MKKIILGTLIIATGLFAIDDSKWYMGIGTEFGKGEYKTTASYSNQTTTENYTTSSMPLKVGYKTDAGNRVEVSLKREDIDKIGDKKRKWSSTNIDWKFVYPQKDSYKYYWNVGLGIYEYEDTAQYISNSNDNLHGTSFAIGIGALKKLSSNLELEINLNSKAIMWEDMYYPLYGVVSREASEQTLYLGVNYHF